MKQEKCILITGVAGLIGSRFADYIIENHPKYKVIGIDNLFGGYIDNVNSNVIFYNLDIAYNDLSDIFNEYNIEYVYHFAAYAAEGLSPFIRKFNYENNLVATANIINECIKHDIKRLVFTSTMAVYGHGQGKDKFYENDQPCPIDPYGVAKYACEQDIRIAGEQHGLDWCIIRPHNVFGVKQNIWDKYRNVLGIWMYKSLNNKPITIYGDGEQTRAFTYIDNILKPLWKAGISPKASKEIINLGGTINHSINKMAQLVSQITGNKEIEYLEKRHEVKYAYPDWKKSVDLLGYEEKYSLEYGLQQMWEWVKTQPNRDQYTWSFYELDKNIYSYWKI